MGHDMIKKEKQEVLGRTNLLLPFDATWTVSGIQ
jgi:hypothetical protein